MKTNIKVISIMIALLAIISYGRVKALYSLNMDRTLFFAIESTQPLPNNYTNLVALYTASSEYDAMVKVVGTQTGLTYDYKKAKVGVYQNFNGFSGDGIVNMTLKNAKSYVINSYSGEAYY